MAILPYKKDVVVFEILVQEVDGFVYLFGRLAAVAVSVSNDVHINANVVGAGRIELSDCPAICRLILRCTNGLLRFKKDRKKLQDDCGRKTSEVGCQCQGNSTKR
ncbi:MAG: hypothetical protein EPGJADBJ_04276 [Saprospiraceae bacterium]|nr:hypothetical protein [Saprospiraceae bacterium]